MKKASCSLVPFFAYFFNTKLIDCDELTHWNPLLLIIILTLRKTGALSLHCDQKKTSNRLRFNHIWNSLGSYSFVIYPDEELTWLNHLLIFSV